MTIPVPAPGDLAQRFASALAQQVFVASDGTQARLDATAPETLEQALSIASSLDLYQIYLYMRDQALEFMVKTATEKGLLPTHAEQWGVPRRGPTNAAGTFIVSVTKSASIPAGTLITIDGSLNWAVNNSIAIPAYTSASITVTATSSGFAGNLPANTAAQFVSPVPGVFSVITDQNGLSGGASVESVESWRSRIIERISFPPGAGTRKDYEQWALAGGAAYVNVVPLALGAGTVSIYVAMSDGRTPTPTELATVQTYIDARRPLTANATVLAAAQVPQNVTIILNPDSVSARTTVTSNLAAYFLGLGIGSTIYREGIEAAISAANGMDNSLLAPSGNTTLEPYEIPVIGTVVWGNE